MMRLKQPSILPSFSQILFLIGATIFFFSCTKKEDIKEIVVIGGGLMGSSTAWHLSNYGENVLLIEKQDSVYTEGSSLGEARIARSSNRGNDRWSYLHNRSVEEARKLISFLNTDPQGPHLSIDDIYTTTPVTYVGRINIFERLLTSLIRQEVEYKMAATPSEGLEMFDVILPDSVLIQKEYNQYSGTINPKTLINYLHLAVQMKGNEIWYNQKVNTIIKKEDFFEIEVIHLKTNTSHIIKSRKVVSAVGPYTGTLLKDLAPYFVDLIKPQRVFLAFFKIDDETYNGWDQSQKEKLAESYPVINSSKGTRDGTFFSMIEKWDEKGHPLIKIGGHFQRSKIDKLDEVWQINLTSDEIDWSRKSTLGYFNLLKLPLDSTDLVYMHGYSCVYSLTSTEVPYVTQAMMGENEKDPDFVVLGGMSGVGAKGAMTYGLIGANLLLNIDESGEMFNRVKEDLGFDRMLEDLKAMN